jgi:hypothetical protein
MGIPRVNFVKAHSNIDGTLRLPRPMGSAPNSIDTETELVVSAHR